MNSQSRTRTQAQPILSKYYQKLREGVLLDEILENADLENQCLESKHISLLKAYEESLSKRKLVGMIDCLKNNVPLSQLISETSSKDLAHMLGYLPGLKIVEAELGSHEKNKDDIFNDNCKIVQSSSVPSLQSVSTECSFYEEKPVVNDETLQCRRPKERQPVKSLTVGTQKDNKQAKLHFFDAWKKTSNNQGKNDRESQDSQLNDPDDEEVVRFGDALNGMTFKEILENEGAYFGWFRWLKYKSLTVKSEQECAGKAYKYFSRHLKYWNDIPPYVK